MYPHRWRKDQFTITVSELRRTSARDVELVNAGAEVVHCGLGRHGEEKVTRMIPGKIDYAWPGEAFYWCHLDRTHLRMYSAHSTSFTSGGPTHR